MKLSASAMTISCTQNQSSVLSVRHDEKTETRLGNNR